MTFQARPSLPLSLRNPPRSYRGLRLGKRATEEGILHSGSAVRSPPGATNRAAPQNGRHDCGAASSPAAYRERRGRGSSWRRGRVKGAWPLAGGGAAASIPPSPFCPEQKDVACFLAVPGVLASQRCLCREVLALSANQQSRMHQILSALNF